MKTFASFDRRLPDGPEVPLAIAVLSPLPGSPDLAVFPIVVPFAMPLAVISW